MSEPSDRPDPDVLLRRIEDAEVRQRRGKLKIFFGFAPGVGKTYRMLQVARDLIIEHKNQDVVVGIVEDHKRRETAHLVLGLELLARCQIEYRGRILDEFDLDRALARKPKLILVDELAHTNAPGSRHPKRWQDVEELLDAGIDVFTTMNVQHVESLNDVIAQITRVQVRETVPDSVLDRADAIELIDIAPEELLARLKEGKVYLPDQAQRAAEHFFQRGNLLALRELALRRTAQHVDEDVLEFREEHGVATTWPAGERILVCVGAAPTSGRLIRSAARMAAGLRCPWIACYVESTTSRPMSNADRERLEAHLRVAETLGATIARLTGPRISDAVLQYARRNNVTRLVIGKPTHARLRDRLRGSLLDDVVRGSGDIDVHVISGDASGQDSAPSERVQRPHAPAGSYLSTLLIMSATLTVSLGVARLLHLPDVEMLFLLAVMATAGWFGRGPGILASVVGVLVWDFFFVPPYYTFSVSDQRYVLTFFMMFGIGFVMSELASRLRRQERDAQLREERTAALYALTRELAAADQAVQIAEVAARHAADAFAARVVLLGAGDNGDLQSIAAVPQETRLDVKELGVAKWCLEHDALAGLGTDTLPGAAVLCAPLRAGSMPLGVLALVPHDRAMLTADQRALLDVFCRQVALCLERARLSGEAKQAALRAKTEEMRSSLLSAVSHDLRTPLAAITGAATAVRDEELSDETRADLVSSIIGEATRLERLVGNLLDMTRLESGGVLLKRDWIPLDEIVSSALTRLEERLEQRSILMEIHNDVPLVYVDPVLFEQLFVNLLENADKYTPAQAPIEIRARREGQLITIEVIDHGPGIPPAIEKKIFDKFFRGPHQGVSGAGLGLPICKGIVEAHGGTIVAENHTSGGAVFRIVLPTKDGAPSAEPLGTAALPGTAAPQGAEP